MLASRSITSIARSRNVGAQKSSAVDHLRYLVDVSSATRLKLRGLPMLTSFRWYCTRESAAAYDRQMSPVESSDALSLMIRTKSEYVCANSESSDCRTNRSELYTGRPMVTSGVPDIDCLRGGWSNGRRATALSS